MQISLLDHQYDFIASEKKYALLVGGIGSGKTMAGSVYATRSAAKHPKAIGGIFANTYKQLQNSTLKALFDILTELGISFSFNQQRSMLNINGAQVLCMSLENYDVIRGVELGWIWVDECAYAKEDAFTVLAGRLRDKKGPLTMRLTSSPRGFNWMFDYFLGDKKTDEFELFEAATKDNPHLPQSYVNTLYEQYDNKLAEQELEGKFTNVHSGRVYYAFDRKVNVADVPFRPDHPIYCGNDFNINPMSAVLSHHVNGTIEIFDEIFMMSSNTQELADHIIAKYGTGHTIIPDATGKATKTNYAKSDHQILRDAGFIIPSVRNPFRVDRYNCCNSLLSKGLIKIDSKAKNLIKDLEKVQYKIGSDVPDTSDPMVTHISDALGYLCWYFYPLINTRVRVTPKVL